MSIAAKIVKGLAAWTLTGIAASYVFHRITRGAPIFPTPCDAPDNVYSFPSEPRHR